MTLVIKKRVSLEFLGDEYKDSYLTFQSIPARDLPEITESTEKYKDDPKKIIPAFIEILEKYFVDGNFQDQEVKKEDVGELDVESVIHCFQILTGQSIDPKDNGESTSTSTTEAS